MKRSAQLDVSHAQRLRSVPELRMKRSLISVLLLLGLATFGHAQSPCTAAANNLIARYMKGATRSDRTRAANCFVLLRQVQPGTVGSFENVLLVDLANTPIDEVSGVANPKHWVRATSGWTTDPALAERYILAVEFFRDPLTGKLKPGIALQASTPRSTTNIRRVAGGDGSIAEAWEPVSTHEMVLRGFFTRDEVREFGLKVNLTGGGSVEADVWVIRGSERILIDQKHTLGDSITRINDELIDRWIAGLTARDFHKVLIPTNQAPSTTLIERIEQKLLAQGLSLSLIEFVSDLTPF